MTRAARGFTILEAMIAAVIVLVASVGIVGISNQGVLLTAEGRHLTRAAALAQEFAALSQVWNYTDARLSVGSHSDSGSTKLTSSNYFGTSNATLAAAGSDFARSWTVTALEDKNGNGTQDGISIVFTVSWTQHGLPRSANFYMTRVNPLDHL